MDDEGQLSGALNDENSITLNVVKQAMLRARHADVEDVEFANALYAEAGDYLPSHIRQSLIRADITGLEAAPEILAQKAFFKRILALFPALARFFQLEDRQNIIGLLMHVDDCHNDYHVSANAIRRDRKHRETIQSLNDLGASIQGTVSALEDSHYVLDDEFRKFYELYFSASAASLPNPHDIGQLIQELKVCLEVAHIVKVRASMDDEYLHLTGNDKRSVLVEYAYDMSRMWNGPPLLTTPGSDFSALCSLLFEVVTGSADESLAGAINRFSRSEDRKKRDREEDEYRSEEQDNDNFVDARRTMKGCAENITVWRALLGNSSLNREAKNLVRLRLQEETKALETARDAYGPHRIYMSDQETATFSKSFDPRMLARLEIELGNARRGLRTRVDPSSLRSAD